MRALSPLRYPGGKSCLYNLISTVLRENRLEKGHYVEPYAGGCGLGLSLLIGGHVSDIHINDLDVSIWSFWDCVLNRTKELIELVQTSPITLEQWHRQKKIHSGCNSDSSLQLAFATFFLNRTNRSGIIAGAGVIGGLSQKGSYKMDCRFNRDDLSRRIERVARYRSRIHLSNLDAISFMHRMETELPRKTLFCIDPPYFKKGSSLYTNFYGPDEHQDVAKTILTLVHPWIVTYDHTPEIQSYYAQRRQFLFDINYSIQTKRIGSELLIASKGLRLPEEVRTRKADRHLSSTA